MILWSILTKQAWEQLQRKGYLRTDRRCIWKERLIPYQWMTEQMVQRLSIPRPTQNTMPVWAWYQWENEKRCKPDLRSGCHLPKGDEGVRIEFQADDEKVLLSDFELWHYVLNYWYLPNSERDGNAFEKKLAKAGLSFFKHEHSNPLPHAQYRREIERSWERIFDIGWSDKRHAIAVPLQRKSIQATLWELRLEEVLQVKEFTAR
jgi:hypothetical protein